MASAAAVFLYLVPVALFLIARARKDRALWEFALDIPLVVALDLLSILALARLVRLETAILVSRVLWPVGGAVWIWLAKKQRKLGWPSGVGRRELALALVAASVGLFISLQLSRTCEIWDRQWHIPLVSSLLGQKLPFMNVFEPRGGLYYHFAGNVLAGVFQALSFSTIHASLALSLAHDVMFALTAVTLALLLNALGLRSFIVIALLIGATLLTGPALLLRDSDARPATGYSVINFLSLSFRPHVSLGALLMLGFVGSVLVRLRNQTATISLWKTAPPLIASTALSILTDETSIGLLGVALGAAWLVNPNVIHPKRLRGLAVFGALIAALVLPILLFVGFFGPGAPVHTTTIVPWRNPGFYAPPVPLDTPEGRRILLEDLFPIFGVLLAGAISLLRARSRVILTAFVFSLVLAVISLLGFTRLEIDGSALECHRFVTASLFLSPIMAAYFVIGGGLRPASAPVSLEALVVYVSLAIPGASTLEWLEGGMAERLCVNYRGFRTPFSLYHLSCRVRCGSTLGQAAAVTYASEPVAYLYTGCTPTFVPGPAHNDLHKIKVGAARFGLDALRDIHDNMLSPKLDLTVACEVDSEITDPVCAFVTSRGLCQPLGTRIQRCSLTPAQRRELLGLPARADPQEMGKLP